MSERHEPDDAEAIARVVADLQKGRVRHIGDERMRDMALALIDHPTVVNATAIYHSLVARDEPVYVYEDHPCISPPWEEAAICFRNEHGNVIVMHATTNESSEWETENPVDWERVRWRLFIFVWLGGGSDKTGPVMTGGPVHLWQFAIYDNGEPADLRWVQLATSYPLKNWDMAHLVLLGALNFLNCRNVELVTPQRPRPARRRIGRLGVNVHTINVTPFGRSTRNVKGEPVGGTPLTSVRGHFASYGPEFGRGLLFGRLAGRFWIPQHARGDREHGESSASYELQP